MNRRGNPGISLRVSDVSAGSDKQVSRYERAASSSEITRTGFRSVAIIVTGPSAACSISNAIDSVVVSLISISGETVSAGGSATAGDADTTVSLAFGWADKIASAARASRSGAIAGAAATARP